MSITFEVSSVKLAKEKLKEQSISNCFTKQLLTEAEDCSEPKKQIIPCEYNSFVGAVHNAFNDHRPLILSPDIIWVTIAQGLATHINKNAEYLRHHFVDHQGKLYIEISRDSFVKGGKNNDWPRVFPEFSDKIGEYIGKKRDLIVSNFSTTDLLEKTISEIVLMDSMKSYFSYGMRTLCGIPSITLEGTTDDWKHIYCV